MDEGTREQERQPIISSLFPVGEEAARTAFSNLNPRQISLSVAQVASNEEKRILDEGNPDIAAYFGEMLLTKYPEEDHRDRVSLGILIFHRALREKANAEGVEFPRLKEKFILDYKNERQERIDQISRDSGKTTKQAEDQLNREDLIKFEHKEEKFSEIVRENFSIGPEWRREQDLKYLGIIYTYSLFRKGLSDPKNFEQNPK